MGMGPLSSLEVSLTSRGEAYSSGGRGNKATPLCVCTSVIWNSISNQSKGTDLHSFGDRALLIPLSSCKLCASCSRNMPAAACAGSGASCWVVTTVTQAFPWKLQDFIRLQSTKIIRSNRFSQDGCCGAGGDRGSRCFHHLPRTRVWLLKLGGGCTVCLIVMYR